MFGYSTMILPKAHLLDKVPNAVCGYSVNRQLKRSHAGGNMFEVQRSSDNTNQIITLLGNGLTDFATENTFVSTNTGFVKTWYDQSGNGRNVSQATQINMPKRILTGTEQVKDTIPAIFFDRTTDPDALAGTIGTYSQTNTIIVFASASATDSNGRIIDSQNGSNRNMLDIANAGNILMSGGTQQTMTTATTNLSLYIAEFSGATSSLYIKETLYPAPATVGTNALESLYIGRNAANNTFYTGHLIELIIYNRALTTNERRLIVQDYKAFYNI